MATDNGGLPEGWRYGPPDFVGVGAQRAGTTWWHQLIISHPDVSFRRGSNQKETHFFDWHPDLAALDAELIEQYHRLFPRAPGTLAGEWTPRYMLDPWTPPLLVQAAPEARILIMLRDPVDRYESGLARGVLRAARLAREGGEAPSESQIASEQIVRSQYREQVERMLAAYPRDRVLILQYERCRAAFEAELARTFTFLGLREVVGAHRGERNLPREPRARPTAAADRERLARIFAPDVRALLEIAPEIDVDLWNSVRELV
jgi:hypothetical protein